MQHATKSFFNSMLGNFSCFCNSPITFFQNQLFPKRNSFRNIRVPVSNSLNPNSLQTVKVRIAPFSLFLCPTTASILQWLQTLGAMALTSRYRTVGPDKLEVVASFCYLGDML